MLVHVVLFKLNDPSEENIFGIINRLKSLKERIPILLGLEVGADIVQSDRSYDIALIARFDNRERLDEYQNHPAHLEVLAYMRPRIEVSKAVDFVS